MTDMIRLSSPGARNFTPSFQIFQIISRNRTSVVDGGGPAAEPYVTR